MDSKIFENKLLLDYFSNVIYVNSNPATLSKTNVSKVNGEVKVINEKKIIKLRSIIISKDSINLMTPECYCHGFIDDIKNNSPSRSLNYSKGFFSFFTKTDSNINKFLKSLKNKYYIITTSEVFSIIDSNLISNSIHIVDDYDEFYDKKLKDIIIIGQKDELILKKDYFKTEYVETFKIEYYFNLKNFLVINLH